MQRALTVLLPGGGGGVLMLAQGRSVPSESFMSSSTCTTEAPTFGFALHVVIAWTWYSGIQNMVFAARLYHSDMNEAWTPGAAAWLRPCAGTAAGFSTSSRSAPWTAATWVLRSATCACNSAPCTSPTFRKETSCTCFLLAVAGASKLDMFKKVSIRAASAGSVSSSSSVSSLAAELVAWEDDAACCSPCGHQRVGRPQVLLLLEEEEMLVDRWELLLIIIFFRAGAHRG